MIPKPFRCRIPYHGFIKIIYNAYLEIFNIKFRLALGKVKIIRDLTFSEINKMYIDVYTKINTLF